MTELRTHLLQFNQDRRHCDMIQPLLDSVDGVLALAPYDGIAEFHAKDSASIQRFITHAFGDPAIAADQQLFVDSSYPLQIMVGYDNLIFGSGIKTSGGKHGILPDDPRLNGHS